MRFKKLDLNLLVALDHLLELRSVSAAAEKMFLSQSAMSNALTRIRTYFDDPILVQIGRRMELTPLAEALRPSIRDILIKIEATIDTDLEFRPEQSTRKFNLLLSDYTMRVLMPHVFGVTQEQSATVRFNLSPQTQTPYSQLVRGEVDMLVCPKQFVSKDHPSELLYEDEYVAVACKKGRYGTLEMTKAVYEAASHVVMVPPNNAVAVESGFLEISGVTRKVDVTTFSFSNLPYLIPGTDRIATVHRRLAELTARQNGLVIHPIPFISQPFQQMIQWHAYRDHDPGLRWLRSVFKTAAKRLPNHSLDQ